jgi:hypothetical protein
MMSKLHKKEGKPIEPEETEKPISSFVKGFDLFSVDSKIGFDFARIKQIR